MPIPAGPAGLGASWIREAFAAEGDPRAGEIRSAQAEVIGVGPGLDGTVARVTTSGPRGESGTLVDRSLAVPARGGCPCDPSAFQADMDGAFTVHSAGAVRSKERGTGPSVPRLGSVIENLVIHVAAAVEDRLGYLDRRA